MPGEENSVHPTVTETEDVLDSRSSDDGYAPVNEPVVVENYHVVYQDAAQTSAKCMSFVDLKGVVDFARSMSGNEGFRAFFFTGIRLKTTRFPAPHLVLDSGEMIPLFDNSLPPQEDDGAIGPPPAKKSDPFVFEPHLPVD